ncbi:putative transcription factor interactor and regulator CCHC(Zn) family [Helianthus annuus]|uniref:Transcription factor interactor and regulator CCHC(Zn) family n=1 Tax=Helianthus annuus TaxID=4232 RepID=A0A9K3NS05_HELAN|nr:putative transcription factor interactor and regulator CCHC(Zn) family [Helianthus annuus]KAJ0580749.1 putative transcription factor interactor and regulator CCHC(Zn) family [Helianthus annuus]KAJ0588423.1 putative transcription factor interactor and regulator CCHC(Zn) family [Helianthus annuus]KAJ0596697.1 putative transcription factor interactor and regulator CCHC(Zn) family [Helianthus annuus]KAJ0757369.1 putative transcription factor interactor and regulator CCHC(Zn) family [Helianthus a
MASVIRRAQRFMEITRRKCLEGHDMKLGFDRAKVTCFKCKQKGHFKIECTNRQADDSVNPFHDDYYKKATYHHTNEQPSRTNQKQIDEGSSKDRKQALIMIQEDEGFNWNKYIKKEEKKALVVELRASREERHARMRLGEVYEIFMEAKHENRWDDERKCFLDPQGNPTIDPNVVDFKALVGAIPTAGVFYSKIKEDLKYEKEVEEGIRRVIYASMEKKKSVEEIVDESKKLKEEILKKTTDNTPVEDQVEITTQTESTKSSDNAKSTDKIDEIDNESEKKTDV